MSTLPADLRNQIIGRTARDPLGAAYEHIRHLTGAIDLANETTAKGEPVTIATEESAIVADVIGGIMPIPRVTAGSNHPLLCVMRHALSRYADGGCLFAQSLHHPEECAACGLRFAIDCLDGTDAQVGRWLAKHPKLQAITLPEGKR